MNTESRLSSSRIMTDRLFALDIEGKKSGFVIAGAICDFVLQTFVSY